MCYYKPRFFFSLSIFSLNCFPSPLLCCWLAAFAIPYRKVHIYTDTDEYAFSTQCLFTHNQIEILVAGMLRKVGGASAPNRRTTKSSQLYTVQLLLYSATSVTVRLTHGHNIFPIRSLQRMRTFTGFTLHSIELFAHFIEKSVLCLSHLFDVYSVQIFWNICYYYGRL